MKMTPPSPSRLCSPKLGLRPHILPVHQQQRGGQSQNPKSWRTRSPALQQQQKIQPSEITLADDLGTEWVQLLQPRPIAPNHQHRPQQRIEPHPELRKQLQLLFHQKQQREVRSQTQAPLAQKSAFPNQPTGSNRVATETIPTLHHQQVAFGSSSSKPPRRGQCEIESSDDKHQSRDSVIAYEPVPGPVQFSPRGQQNQIYSEEEQTREDMEEEYTTSAAAAPARIFKRKRECKSTEEMQQYVKPVARCQLQHLSFPTTLPDIPTAGASARTSGNGNVSTSGSMERLSVLFQPHHTKNTVRKDQQGGNDESPGTSTMETTSLGEVPSLCQVALCWHRYGAKQEQVSAAPCVSTKKMRLAPHEQQLQDFSSLNSALQQQQTLVQHQETTKRVVAAPVAADLSRPSQHEAAGTQLGFATGSSRLGNHNIAEAESASFPLPSTLIPPTVLASVLVTQQPQQKQQQQQQQNQQVAPPEPQNPEDTHPVRSGLAHKETPQAVLEKILKARGYRGSTRINSEQACYETIPSPLQLASFGMEVIRAVHNSDVKLMAKLLSAGLSPNACNQFRDSILDLVCKRSNYPIFRCLLHYGCDLRVTDGFGRTPLHHCCWAVTLCKEIAKTIVKNDWHQWLVEDAKGQTPLEYVRSEQADSWIDFMESNADTLLPQRGAFPKFISMKDVREEKFLPNPPNALPIQLAADVSSGKRKPEEVSSMPANEKRRSFEEKTERTP